MGIEIHRYGDVTRVRMRSLTGTAMGVEVSAYVIDGVLIDTGFPRAGVALVDALSALHVTGAILTHSHEDHAGNAELLARRGIPISMRADTEAILRQPPRLRLYRRLAWGVPSPLRADVRPFRQDGFAAVATPGHSPDHQVVWHATSRTLFSGDLWLGVRYAVMHSWEDPYLSVESLKTARALEPARMFDAHLGPVAHPVRALTGKIRWLSETIDRVEQAIRDGDSDAAIVKHVLGGEGLPAVASFGEYAVRNFVQAVRRHQARSSAATDVATRRSPLETPSSAAASTPPADRRDA